MTKKQNIPSLYLSDDEMDELGSFLMSEATSDETMMPDCLDGFMTALITAPVMATPGVWLPHIWGQADVPAFNSEVQLERITALIMRHFNSIISRLQENPDACEPVFDSAVYPDSPREYIDGEMWAYGYMKGINLQRQDWQKFFDDQEGAELLRPVYLLGSEDLTPEEEALIETPGQREELSRQIPASIAALYRYWQPYRPLVPVGSFQREQAKIGRNEKCPCGSGRKFKKCCGVSVEQ
ncbi:MAG: UPF0149 family protein [Gallionella sp.]|nr:UPF0149 family protein [Gallionella sp.]